MNCPEVCERLLAADVPSCPPQVVQEHLQGCRECRDLLQRLCRLREEVEALPLPPASPQTKGRFIEQWRRDTAYADPPLCRPIRRGPSLALVVSLVTAGLLVGAGLWWLFVSAWGTARPGK